MNISTLTYIGSSERISLDLHPNILRTCKAVYLEAIPILFKQNLIVFQSEGNKNAFEIPYAHGLPAAGRAWYYGHFCNRPLFIAPCLDRIQHLDLQFGCDLESERARVCLKHVAMSCPQLKTFRITPWSPWNFEELREILNSLRNAHVSDSIVVKAFQYMLRGSSFSCLFSSLAGLFYAWAATKEYTIVERALQLSTEIQDQDSHCTVQYESGEWLLIPRKR